MNILKSFFFILIFFEFSIAKIERSQFKSRKKLKSSLTAASLTNYWPMNNLKDIIGGSNLFDGENYSFVSDRFGNPNSAIYFRNGFLKVPPGVYFNGDSTIIAYIFLKSYQPWTRIMIFGNIEDNFNDALILGMTSTGINLRFEAWNGSSPLWVQSDPFSINLETWYHVAFVIQNTIGYIYVNGIQINNGIIFPPNNVLRSDNFFGKTHWDGENNDAIFDDLKIFKSALSPQEMMQDYINSKNNPCGLNPCKNNGTCINSPDFNSYICQCIIGFTDKNCLTALNPCGNNVCLNGGSCKNSYDFLSYTCLCNIQFTGSNCQQLKYPCDFNPCKNNGTCTNSKDLKSYTCACDLGFSDSNCSKKLIVNNQWTVSDSTLEFLKAFINYKNSSIWYQVFNKNIVDQYNVVSDENMLSFFKSALPSFDIALQNGFVYLLIVSNKIYYFISDSTQIEGPIFSGNWTIKSF